jgi:REP element-mobilizing transposase RayT
MRKVLGYMLTWTTYGSWLQGDRRGYVKDGKILDAAPALENSNRDNLNSPPVSLNSEQRNLVKVAVHNEAEKLHQKILAFTVRKSHVHLVVDCNFLSASSAVSHYKNAARLLLQSNGFIGKLWTRGYSVRYCFDDAQLSAVINYVNKHDNPAHP